MTPVCPVAQAMEETAAETAAEETAAEETAMENKGTSTLNNGLIWFGAGVSIAGDSDRNVSGASGI